MKKIVVSKLEENTNDSDIHGLAKLAVATLKDELTARDLSNEGNKPELHARLEEYLNLVEYNVGARKVPVLERRKVNSGVVG